MNDKIELYLTHCIRLTVQMFTVEQSTLSAYSHQTKPVCFGTLNVCSVHFKPIGISIFFYITAPIQMVLLYATLGTYWTSLPAFQYIFAIIKEINGTKNKIPIGLKWTLHTLR
jgi:hypothetical protein